MIKLSYLRSLDKIHDMVDNPNVQSTFASDDER